MKRSSRLLLRFFGTLVSSGALMACGGAQTSSPEGALQAYAHALHDGRSDDAYALVSDTGKKALSLEQFRAMVKQNPEDAKDLAKSLDKPSRPAEVTATVTTQTGQTLELVLERGRWKLDASSVDLYAQDTPRHALVGFVRAVERKRYDILLRYITDAHRVAFDEATLKAAWEGPDKEEVARVVGLVRTALASGAAIEETGTRATLSYGTGTVQLQKERSAWKIEDFD
jgi:hypothetical protein